MEEEEFEYKRCKKDTEFGHFRTELGAVQTITELSRNGWAFHELTEDGIHIFKRRKGYGRGEERNLGGEDSGKVLLGN
jgi:hypothetical protein